ncbi:phosphatidylglycerophosphate phosphatase PTPMT2 [Elaeis guineensis]|uniref:phosphatidylglycerophosphatase n=1 Tax=Elaeis guineensis var. tenera TaxID=51953 RepID=A0A6I9RCR9_ELAGV|nr:putative dual specificity protein phosphatase DSP8 [Elaeis guineensis]XP_029121027.1 putative dual specificity protein phosphatase DSP8 [Elaeis guineensis]
MRITELEDGGSEDLGGRELVPVKAKRALVGAGGRILFYPTLLYNVFRNKIEAEFRWWDEVDQFILLGAVPFPKHVPHLQQLGVRGVITLNEPYETLVPSSLYQAHGIDHLVIPTRDYLFAPSLVDINRAVDFIHRNASNGRITYVHCKAGRGRSTTIVLCYLVEYKHMTPASALEYVRSRRPRVLLAPSQWRAVQEYSKRKQEFPASQGPRPSSSLPGDEVLITAADLEGYGTISEDASNDPSLSFCRLSIPTSPLREDEVLITEADLEGYDTHADACKDTGVSLNGIPETRPMTKRLSCLFTSFKVSRSGQSAASRLAELRAC